MDDPLNGKAEGWPAPGPEAVAYLAGKGIRCVGTDAPTLGGVDRQAALDDLLALGGKGMVGVESLTNLGEAAGGGLLRLRGGQGPRLPRRPGRALAFY